MVFNRTMRAAATLVLVCTGIATGQARAGIITNVPSLPPFGTYAGGSHAFFEFIVAGAPFPILVGDTSHSIPPQPINPTPVCPPLPQPCVTDPLLPGYMQVATFNSTAAFTAFLPGLAIPKILSGVSATTKTTLLSNAGGRREYSNELLSLELQFDLMGMDVLLREDQDQGKQSTGRTSVEDIGGGLFRVDSFFDVFTELSLDNGRTWNDCIVPAGQTACTRVILVPEPAALALVGLALVLLRCSAPRRKLSGKPETGWADCTGADSVGAKSGVRYHHGA